MIMLIFVGIAFSYVILKKRQEVSIPMQSSNLLRRKNY